MKKDEFLKHLENELMPLSSNERYEILNEYENHINEGIQNGVSEERITGRLGAPEEIAAEILSIEEVEAGEDVTEHVTMQSNFLQDIDPEQINVIDIQGDFLAVEIRNGPKFEMNYHSPGENSEFSHGVDGDKLIFKHKRGNANKVHFNILGFLRNRNYRNDMLTIIWPENLTHLKIRTEKGDVDLEGLTAGHFDVRTELGNVNSKSIAGTKGDFTSEMGSITVIRNTFDYLDLTTDMGRLKVDDIAVDEQSYATEMGTIEINKADPEANIDARTSMGAINVEYKKAPLDTQIITKTSVGSVYNRFEDHVDDNLRYTARFTTSMGAINIH